MNIPQLRKKEIVRHFENGLSTQYIAKLFSVSGGYVYNALNKAGISVRNKQPEKINRDKQVIEMYQDISLPLSDITNKFNISPATIYNILKKHNINRKRNRKTKTQSIHNGSSKLKQSPSISKKLERDKKIVEMYRDSNISVADISEGLAISCPTIYKVLHKNNIYVTRKKKQRDSLEKEIISFYVDDKIPVQVISQELSISVTTIYNALSKNNIPLRRRWETDKFLSMKPQITCNCKCSVPNDCHESIVDLYKEGCKITYIATLFKTNNNTIEEIIQNHGIKIKIEE